MLSFEEERLLGSRVPYFKIASYVMIQRLCSILESYGIVHLKFTKILYTNGTACVSDAINTSSLTQNVHHSRFSGCIELASDTK